MKTVSQSITRIDGTGKVTGDTRFGADLNFHGQLYARTLYARRPRAEILNLDVSDALDTPGVVFILTAENLHAKNEMFGRFPVLADKEVKYAGDGIAVVAAESGDSAAEALKHIKVEYRDLPPVLSVEEAIKEGAVLIHPDKEDNFVEQSHHRLIYGDVSGCFSEDKVIVEETYRTGFAEQAYIEPEAVLALPEPGGSGVTVYGTFQNPFSIRENVASVLGLPINRVRIIQTAIGGSFGGKDESVMVMSARAAVIALRTGRPVKLVLTREDCFAESCKRHAYVSKYRIAADPDGMLSAVEDRIVSLGGAYNNKAMFANWRGSIHAAGAYFVPNVKNDVNSVYTNTAYGGAYRGFSAPQIVFAVETAIDELSWKCGISPLQIRLKNCIKPDTVIATGQKLVPGKMPANLEDLLNDVAAKSGFEEKWAEYGTAGPVEKASDGEMSDSGIRKGIGIACTFRGTGLGGEGIDTASATVTIDKDGYVNILSGLSEMGQGIRTSHAQIVAEILGVTFDRMKFTDTDTSVVEDSGPTVASRGLLAGGNAMKIAAETLRERIFNVASSELKIPVSDVRADENIVFSAADPSVSIPYPDLLRTCVYGYGISLSAQGWYSPGPEALDHATGQGNAYPSYIFGAMVAEIEVDTGTGYIEVKKLTSAYEIGKAINPAIVKGQLTGGILQGLGYAVMEDFQTESGYLETENFDDYMIPGILDTPEIDITLFETDSNVGPYGAKGVGEVGVELVAPAIGNALFNATGRRIRELPLSLEQVKLGRKLSPARKI